MNQEQKRVVQYAGGTVLVEFTEPEAGEILTSIIYRFSDPTDCDPTGTFKIKMLDGPIYQLFFNGDLVFESHGKYDFTEMLLSKICYQLAYHSQDGMLFHAAGLGYHNKGILVPGGIGYGKSTFTAWMVKQLDCDYLSDEFVYFPTESSEMDAFYRPIHLKKPSRMVLKYINNMDHMIQSGTYSDLIHPAVFRPNNQYYNPPVNLILFPRYKKGEPFEWRELSAAEAGMELMQFLINARNLPEYGFREITRLVQKTRAIKFSYSSFDQIEKPIQGITNLI